MSDWLRISIWLIASWALAFLFLCEAIHDVQRISPAQFWPWLKIKEEQLENVRAYNIENCNMWLSCAFLFFVNGIIGVFQRKLSAVLLLFLIFPGGFFIIQRYNRILKKYIKKEAIEPNAAQKAEGE